MRSALTAVLLLIPSVAAHAQAFGMTAGMQLEQIPSAELSSAANMNYSFTPVQANPLLTAYFGVITPGQGLCWVGGFNAHGGTEVWDSLSANLLTIYGESDDVKVNLLDWKRSWKTNLPVNVNDITLTRRGDLIDLTYRFDNALECYREILASKAVGL